MKSLHILICGWIAVAFVGCGPTATSPKFTGTWQGTMQVSNAALEKLPAENIAQLKQMKMEMTIREDGTLRLAGETNGKPYTGENRWELVSASPNKVTIKSIDPDGQSKPIDLVFDGNDSFRMPLQTEVADLGAMQFQRVR
jgi:hypothetical protein